MKTKDVIEAVVKGIEGVESLNAMQQAMASAPEGRVMLIAPTGSGKTIAFAIRLLRNIDTTVAGIKGVVIAPTRELVLQIAEVIRKVRVESRESREGSQGSQGNQGSQGREGDGRSCAPARDGLREGRGLRVIALYGGHKMEDERNSLAGGAPDIVVATPGRLVDHLSRGTIDISQARGLVLDEFDKSLQLGFQEQMRRIVKKLRRLNLVVLTSATPMAALPEFVGDIKDFKLYDYSGRVVSPEGHTVYFEVVSPTKDKLPTLVALLRAMGPGKVIVFVNYRDSAERVYERLKREGMPVGLYHGALDQQQRRIALEKLANGTTPILVSTDLASRGLDIPAIDSVVHYHEPIDEETRKHRNGRTARQGATGKVYVIRNEELGIRNYGGQGGSRSYAPALDRLREAGGLQASHGSQSSQLSQSSQSSQAREGGSQARGPRIATLYINAGKREKISKGDVAGYVMKQGGLERDEVGRIMVDDHYALVAVPAAKARDVMQRLAAAKLKGQRVKVSEA